MPEQTKPQKSGTTGEGGPTATSAANEGDGAYINGPTLTKTSKVVLVMDLVELVRLMAQDESGVVARWHGFTKKTAKLIPRHRGRIVKSLGDGLLAEFDHAREAVQVATALHKMIQPANQGRAQDQQLWLRVGINATPVYVDNIDIYGSGVNLAARLASLAGPGETIASAGVRDQLTDGLDADVEDMGECYLKHVEEPVRAYRVGPPGPRPVLVPEKEFNTPLQPTIAVIPFTSRSSEPEQFAIGELIADGVIGVLSKMREGRVISRLSSTALRGRASSSAAASYLGAAYCLSGSYVAMGVRGNAKLICNVELSDTKTNHILWADRFNATVGDLFEDHSSLAHELSQRVAASVFNHQVDKITLQPLPSLESYSLMLGGISMMHHASAADFDRSRVVLEHLCERHRNKAEPRAWLAKWHVLRFVRGVAANRKKDAEHAMNEVKRALDINPDSSLALAMKGHVECQLLGDLDAAEISLGRALQVNSNDALAWLFKSVVSTETKQFSTALSECGKADRLSPIDPLRYLFDLIHSSALLASGNPTDSIQIAERSLRLNCHQPPTLRVLLTAQVEAEQIDAARLTLKRLLREVPGLTVNKYLSSGNPMARTRLQCAGALRRLGLPEH